MGGFRMKTLMRGWTALGTAALLSLVPPTTLLADKGGKLQNVLLISIDGFHAVDLEICVATGTCPHLASLTQAGVTYTNASTTKPSDSFPGLLAQLTGGTPKSTGIFYDDSYAQLHDRAGHRDEYRRAARL